MHQRPLVYRTRHKPRRHRRRHSVYIRVSVRWTRRVFFFFFVKKFRRIMCFFSFASRRGVVKKKFRPLVFVVFAYYILWLFASNRLWRPSALFARYFAFTSFPGKHLSSLLFTLRKRHLSCSSSSTLRNFVESVVNYTLVFGWSYNQQYSICSRIRSKKNRYFIDPLRNIFFN